MMVIRPRGDGDVEKAADDETASYPYCNSFSGSGIAKKMSRSIVRSFTLSHGQIKSF